MSKKFKLNDHVLVTTGRSKGVDGPIIAIKKVKDSVKVKVKSANMQTHFVKANPQENQAGERKLAEGFIDISNVAHYDVKEKKRFKTGFKVTESGKKVRYNKLTDKEVS